MEKRYKLELVGITYNQIQSGVYALILQQVGATRRIPIIIGFPEAQAIECKLQEVSTPRPLTHDTFVAAMSAFGISLKEVEIRKLPNGVFAANLILSDGIIEKTVDSRSSDAIAIAIRVGAPIYTTETVLLEAGFDPEEQAEMKDENDIHGLKSIMSLSSMTMAQLSEAMLKASERENYEEAARIKNEIEKRNKQNMKQ